jgi:hypothetical protein
MPLVAGAVPEAGSLNATFLGWARPNPRMQPTSARWHPSARAPASGEDSGA